jgi:hypothetical protein
VTPGYHPGHIGVERDEQVECCSRTFLSYVTEKRLSQRPEEFGKGAIEGVGGPEAANNATAAGTMVPMLSLGLRTNATAAVMLAALVSFGIQPGPLLMVREGDLVWGLIASLFIGNTLLLLLNLPLVPLWAKLLQIPRPYLYAGIVFFASMGAHAVNGSSFDLILPLVLGLIGFGMRRFGLPVLPLIVGVILGPLGRGAGPACASAVVGRREGPVRRRGRGYRRVPVLGGRDRGLRDHHAGPVWPLIFKLTRKLLPPKAAAAVEGMAHDAEAQVHDPEAHTRKEML